MKKRCLHAAITGILLLALYFTAGFREQFFTKTDETEPIVTEQQKETIKVDNPVTESEPESLETTELSFDTIPKRNIKSELIIPSVQITSDSAHSITVTWDAAQTVSNYHVTLSYDDGSVIAVHDVSESEHTTTFTQLRDNRTFQASVYADYIEDDQTYQGKAITSDTYYLEHVVTIEETALTSQGDCGRLVIPDKNINVALYRGYNTDDSQAIVNAQDSACIIDWYSGIDIIADHWNQGFDNIKSCTPDETYAYIGHGDTVTTYICTNRFTGHNTESDLTDDNYNSITTQNQGGITLYTCNNNWRNITIVYFQPIS